MRISLIACSISLLITFSYSNLSNAQGSSPRLRENGSPKSEPSAAAAKPPLAPGAGIPESPLAAAPKPSELAAPNRPESMFDALETHLTGPVTLVEVHAEASEFELNEPFRAGGQEILSEAGAYGDFERFLQLTPGVVATSDLSNEMLVRGGHPMENLFIVDGIEVPNINHISMPGTTGGFGPMIDSALIQGVKFHTGGYDAWYPERLSSVVEIQTLDGQKLSTHAEGDVGIQGMGGLFEKSIRGSDLLVSAHKGILQFMESAGIGGLPSYENEMIRLRRTSPSGDRLTVLHLGGTDSVALDLCPMDPWSFTTINSQYSGWRETTGIEWQHVYSTRSFGLITASDSEENEHMYQQDQLPDPTVIPPYAGGCPMRSQPPAPPVPVYSQQSNEASSSAAYRFEWSGSHVALSAGSAFWLQRPHYRIEQPLGALSPYSAAPVRSDSTSFASNFSTGESGTFAQADFRPLHRLSLNAGGRLQTFALGAHSTLTPRLGFRFDANERVSFHAAFAAYAQMPPFVYLLSYAQNRALLPMRATHEIAGLDLNPGFGSEIHIEAYNKIYRDIPASTEHPAINLHNVVETLGHQVVWLPLNSGGRGQASGIEISDLTRIGSKLVMRGSVAYSRAMFAGLDGVRRPGNYDLPWIVNLAMLQRMGRGYEVSSRLGYATGRPYTPFDMAHSLAQNRPIYDMSRMNAQRAPYFARLDAQLNKDFMMGNLHLELYVGVNNILNRANFLSYVWLPDTNIARSVGKWDVHPLYELHQMPIFPNFGLRYIFR